MIRNCDVVVVGAGAAGLTAAIVLSRARVGVLVIHDGKPRNAPAAHLHGFVSRDGISPTEFLAIGRGEVERYGGAFLEGRVVDATRSDDGRFEVGIADGGRVNARAVLVATGLTDELPDIPGIDPLWGSAVHHCPHCHGYEVRDQEILVIGGAMPQVTLHQAALLRRYSDRVTLCPNGMDVPGTERARLQAFGVDIVDGVVARLVTDDAKLKAAELADGSLVSADAVFIAPRPRPNDAVLRGLGCTIDPDTGWVVTDQTGATTASGVWATGNVTNPRAQVITAAGEASTTAIAITGWMLDQDVTAAGLSTSGVESDPDTP